MNEEKVTELLRLTSKIREAREFLRNKQNDLTVAQERLLKIRQEHLTAEQAYENTVSAFEKEFSK